MKRKRTELEENLIKNGWELDHKTYTGKHSDIVNQYVYEKVYVSEYKRKDGKIVVHTDLAKLFLDSKRVHIEDVTVRLQGGDFNEIALAYWYGKVKEVEKEVNDCYPTKNDNESEITNE